METSAALSLCLDPALREAAESVLLEGETLSDFLSAAVRMAIERRRIRTESAARGLASCDEVARAGTYFAAEDVHAELHQMLINARAGLQK